MARYKDSVCKLCRRESSKLFLKGDRCYSDRCAFERREYPPGEHGQGRIKFTEYRHQLRETQKLKRMYGVFEKQFRTYYRKAERKKGKAGDHLLIFLERRLDNIVFRLGFANSRSEARQLVTHGHFRVNDRKVDIPSCLLKEGDVVAVREKSRNIARVLSAMESVVRRGVPPWLELEKDQFKGTVKIIPTREEITIPIEDQYIVARYSR